MDDFLEPDFLEPYQAWKTTPGPASNAAMLKALQPTIEGAIQTHVGRANPLLLSRARMMALEGLPGYDQRRGRLQTHMYNHLRGLKRVNRQQTTILKVPERIALDRYNLENHTTELAHELGHDPTDEEIANRTGFSPKRLSRIRSYSPAMAEGTIEASEAGQGGVMGSTKSPQQSGVVWQDIVYDGLDDYHRRIMEYTLGLGGRRPMSNMQIAQKMNRSQGAISQAKLRIQKMLDEEHDLSPFGG